MDKVYRAGIYARLSREDEDAGDQSNSIENQIALLTAHVTAMGAIIAGIYKDDGVSGTTFDRPGFKRLIADIESGKINMVVTKDLSRLGRDITETSRYFQRYFPEHNVRYIAVNDGLDTGDPYNNTNDFFVFKTAFDEMYACDISKKVRTVLNHKIKSGKFIGAHAPYGYKKDVNNRNKLVIDEEAAKIVTRIYSMYMEGLGFSSIAEILNSEGIMSPSVYKSMNTNYINGKNKYYLWNGVTIKNILSNPTYAGHLTQGRRKKVHYKSKKSVILPRQQWTTVYNTHDAIIDQRVFDLVQEMLKRKGRRQTRPIKKIRPLSGFVFCGDCQSTMTFVTTSTNKEYFICSGYKRYGKDYCNRHSILVSEVERLILDDIHSLIDSHIDLECLAALTKTAADHYNEQPLVAEVRHIKTELAKIKRSLVHLYHDKVNNLISHQQFMDLYASLKEERDTLRDRYNHLNHRLRLQKRTQSGTTTAKTMVNKFLNKSSLFTKKSLESLIKRIEIYKDKTMIIYYKFKAPS
jgi:site-specific DNA recombinase